MIHKNIFFVFILFLLCTNVAAQQVNHSETSKNETLILRGVAELGYLAVLEKYRGQGISHRLMTAILDKLSHVPAIKLDATIPGRKVYQKMDFKDEYTLSRMASQFLALPDFDDYEKKFPWLINGICRRWLLTISKN